MSSGKDLHERLPADAIGIPMDAFLDALKWDADGLVTVITQDAWTLAVLGVAFANREAVRKTLETGKMHYYSRSRKKQWMKGEESGHFQILKSLRADCDGDALLAFVDQMVGNCHLGYHSCFNLEIASEQGAVSVTNKGHRVFDPKQAYKK